jgi:hypothetical protein
MARKKSNSAAIATVARQIEKLKNANMTTDESKKDKSTKDKSANEKPIKSENSDSKISEKRPKTAYQIFVSEKLEQLREQYKKDNIACPAYRDLMKIIVEEWHDKKDTLSTSKSSDNNTKPNKSKKDKETTRKPSEYNLFIKSILPILKKEHENDTEKIPQKEYMKMAAEKWKDHKLTKNIN